MITYVYAIDPFNRVVVDDGVIYSETEVWGYLKDIGWVINADDWDKEESKEQRRELVHIFSQRNFFLYEQRQGYYEELRDGIFCI